MKKSPRRSLAALWLVLGVSGGAALGASPARGEPRLSSLKLQAAAGGMSALNPAFSESAFNYTVDVKSDIDEVAIIPSVSDGSALSISVNGQTASSGDPLPVRLPVGDNTEKIEVRDRAGRNAMYSVIIKREDIRPVVENSRS